MKQDMTQATWARPLAALGTLSLLLGSAVCVNAQAQVPAVTPQQQSRASEVAQSGLPLSELAPNAPDSYTVKRGDTLWGISGIFLTRPWRWPELWGMNLQEIRNPHLIFPGQRLFLEKKDGRASLRTNPPLQPEAGGTERRQRSRDGSGSSAATSEAPGSRMNTSRAPAPSPLKRSVCA